jgi:hypothetical protein
MRITENIDLTTSKSVFGRGISGMTIIRITPFGV